MPKQIGLPSTARMRHDHHFVEELAVRHTEAVGRRLPLDRIQPNPDQPRQSFGNLEEMVASVRNVGILEPLLVREVDDGFQIISGERRYRAAREAGLDEVPCIVLQVSDAEVLEIALIENLQRQDLSPFEEADGLQALIDRFGYTHEVLAERIGKSRSTVTESLSLMAIPADIRADLANAGVTTKSILLEIARKSDPVEQRDLADRVIDEGLTRDDLRRLRRPDDDAAATEAAPDGTAARAAAPDPPRRLTYRSGRGITVTLYLNRPDIGVAEIQATLREAIEELDAGD